MHHIILHEKGTVLFFNVSINGEKIPMSFKLQKSGKYTLVVCYVIVLPFYYYKRLREILI